MGLDDRHHRQPPSQNHHQKKDPRYHHTAEYKKPPKPAAAHDTKFATAPAYLEKPSSGSGSGGGNADKKIFVSLISQSEYMKRHLYIKTGVDHERSVLRYQVKKVSIRNYTPKAINQDINMGMWI